jgi:hypothetical protein
MAASYALSSQNAKTVNMAERSDMFADFAKGSHHARKYPGMPAFFVATVTQTRSRAEELRKDLQTLLPRVASRQAYPFIAFDDLTLAALAPAPGSDEHLTR